MRHLAAVFVLSAAAALGGCGDDEPVQEPPKGPSNPAPVAAAPPNPGRAVDAGPPPPDSSLPVRDILDRDFVESDRSRDPFRSYESLFVAQAKKRADTQRPVLIDKHSLDELKLVGLVTRGAPRALLVDPTGLGWVVKVGDFVGKAEVIQLGGATGTDVPINWRVDRIRDGDVVFVREDVAHPEIPPSTRVMSLRPEEQAGSTPRR